MARVLHENIRIDLARISYAGQYERDTIISFKSLYNGNILNKLQLEMGKLAKAIIKLLVVFYNCLLLIDNTGFVRFYSNQRNAIQQLGKYNLSNRKKTIWCMLISLHIPKLKSVQSILPIYQNIWIGILLLWYGEGEKKSQAQ